MTPDDLSRLAEALLGAVGVGVLYVVCRIRQIRAAQPRSFADRPLGVLLDGIEGPNWRCGSVTSLLCQLLPTVELEEIQRLGLARRSAYYNIFKPAAIRTANAAELATVIAEASARMKDVAALKHLNNMAWCLDEPPFTLDRAARVRQAIEELTAYELDKLKHGHLLRPSQGEPETLLRPAESTGAPTTELLLPSEDPTSAAADPTHVAQDG